MLCCGGEKDSARDMKSAQNTPSRQPMHPPYPQPGQQQQQQQQQQLQTQQQLQQQGMMGQQSLMQQANRFPPLMSQINNYPKDDFRKVKLFKFRWCIKNFRLPFLRFYNAD
jgi:hypothetical protein